MAQGRSDSAPRRLETISSTHVSFTRARYTGLFHGLLTCEALSFVHSAIQEKTQRHQTGAEVCKLCKQEEIIGATLDGPAAIRTHLFQLNTSAVPVATEAREGTGPGASTAIRMKPSVLLVLVTLAVLLEIGWWGQSKGLECGRSPSLKRELDSPSGRIFGGKVVADCQVIPWQVRIQTGYRCGGTLISNKHVLTAGHCLSQVNSLSQVDVYIGDYYIYEKENWEEERTIKNYTIHPDFKFNPLRSDIAVITLTHPIPYNNPCVKIMCLDNPPMYLNGQECITSGWGIKDAEQYDSPYLKMVKIPSYRGENCPSEMREEEKKVCSKYPAGGRDTCQGDSGGPLMCWDNQNQRFVQVGVTSTSTWGGCGKKGSAAVYTDVSYFHDWIYKIMWENP